MLPTEDLLGWRLRLANPVTRRIEFDRLRDMAKPSTSAISH
jgi:hypothetical protein